MRTFVKSLFISVCFVLAFSCITSAQTPTQPKVAVRKAPAKAKAPSKAKAPVKVKVVVKAEVVVKKTPASRPTSQPTSRPVVLKPLTANETLVYDFWKAVIQQDYQSLFGLTGVPFVSDDKCTVFGKHEDLEDYLRKQKLPSSVTVGQPSTISMDDKQPGYIQRILDELAPQQANCKDETVNNLITKAIEYPVQFVSVTLTVGNQKVFTLMRLSKIEGKWLVTGLKN